MTASLNDFLLNEQQVLEIGNVDRKKYLQKLRIIKHLFLNGDTSNAGICSRFSLSLPTSMGLINQLLSEGMIAKKGQGKSEGGRKPDLYGLVDDSFFVLSIHIGRYGLKLALIDNNHRLIAENSLSLDISKAFDIVDILHENSLELLKNANLDLKQIMGVGISMPGLVSTHEGKNFTYYLKEQEPESLREKLARKFDKSIVILNDAKSACLAEYRFGQAKDRNNALVISMDWGIGLGIIMGGKIQDGASGFSGEFGHIPFTDDGLLCHCGKRGCLETEASGLALVRKTKEGLQKGQISTLSDLSEKDFDKMDPTMVIDAANKGDQFAINMLSQLGIDLGKGIAVLIQLFNPEIIVLEGKIAEAKQFITTPIQQSMNTYCMIQLKEKTTIALSELGPNTNLYGATIAAVDAVFKTQMELLKNQIN
ncbi:ROK family protein [Flavimarina sp. Hel_I_48]|uniref:ROK family protein n=1 Tax=Flavimarina sp. Hel_I_48 TaxID=1392488 RepID=UPI0004DEDF1C|nr:ROK family protein [Flavimarina sp. Hel_I_48]